jgi:hypothetical protein
MCSHGDGAPQAGWALGWNGEKLRKQVGYLIFSVHLCDFSSHPLPSFPVCDPP